MTTYHGHVTYSVYLGSKNTVTLYKDTIIISMEEASHLEHVIRNVKDIQYAKQRTAIA